MQPRHPHIEKNRRKRSYGLLIFLLPLLCIAVFFASQAGLVGVRPSTIDLTVAPNSTADYGPWHFGNFQPVDPLLGTLIAGGEEGGVPPLFEIAALPSENPQTLEVIALSETAVSQTETRASTTNTSTVTETTTATLTPTMTETATSTLTATETVTATETATETPTATNTPTDTATPLPNAPIALFTANPLSGTAPLTVNFINQSTGSITSYMWNFGDGVGISAAINPVYTFNAPGNYTVTLGVTGPGGTSFYSLVISAAAPTATVIRIPTQTFTPLPTVTNTPLPTLTPTNTATITLTSTASPTYTPVPGTLFVTKNVMWGAYPPDGSMTFQICVTGPSYPGGNCQNAGWSGGILAWNNLIPGSYSVTESNPGGTWSTSIVGSPAVVPVGGVVSATVDNTHAAYTPLTLTSICSDYPAVTRRWRVTNSNAYDVVFTYELLGSAQIGTYTAPASNSLDFDTNTIPDPNTLRILVNGVQEDIQTSGGVSCLGNLNVNKVVDWSGVSPDPLQTFQICITGPSFPGGDCQTIGSTGGTLVWNSLQPGNYQVDETSPGAVWSVAGSGVVVAVATNGTTNHSVNNTLAMTPTPTVTPTPTLTPTNTPIPCSGGGTAGEPNIGAPNGTVYSVACGSAIIVDLIVPLQTGPGYDLVFYESYNAGMVEMDWVVIEVGATASGPWFEVFNWGDNILDANTNLGAAGHGGASGEPDNYPLPAAAPYYGIAPYITGVTIDVEARAPAGIYQWVRISAPLGGFNDPGQVDSLQVLNFAPATATPTETPTETFTPTFTDTATFTPTFTPTFTETPTPTFTFTPTFTDTPSETPTETPTETFTPTNTPVPVANLGVTMVASNPNPIVGEQIDYTITYSNSGPDTAFSTVILSPLPAEVSYVTHAGGTYDPGTGVWTLGDLVNGQNATISITVIVNASASGKTTDFTAMITSSSTDPDGSNNLATASITVP